MECNDPMLYVHLLWLLGHPEVYILVLPPMAWLSRIVADVMHKCIFHRQAQCMAMQLIGIIGYLVYGQQLLTMGISVDSRSYYQSMTLLVAIPTGQKMLTWVGALYGTVAPEHPICVWLESFILQLSLGGLSGLMLALSIVDIS